MHLKFTFKSFALLPALFSAAFFGGLLLAQSAIAATGDVVYSVKETVMLPILSRSSMPYAINDAGQIVGSSAGLAVLWENDAIFHLSKPDWFGSAALDINNAGDIVGWTGSGQEGVKNAFLIRNDRVYFLGDYMEAALRTRPETTYTDDYYSLAIGINESGEIVGWADDRNSNDIADGGLGLSAVRWQTYPTLSWEFFGSGPYTTVSTDINEVGIAAARGNPKFYSPGGFDAPFFQHFINAGDGTENQETPGDGGLCYERRFDGPSINNNNWVVGSFRLQDGYCRAARFQSNGPPILLGGTEEKVDSRANDVNDQDMAVGIHDNTPVFWPRNEDAIELPMLDFGEGEATSINNKMEIVGWLRNGIGHKTPVLWRLEKKEAPQPGLEPKEDDGRKAAVASPDEHQLKSGRSVQKVEALPIRSLR